MRAAASILVAALAVAGCAQRGTPDLLIVRGGAGPDEFSILPSKPLETPPSLAELPPPTPGGANRTDASPEADAIAALGGRPGTGAAVDGGLLSYAMRFGVEPGIRTTLAARDLEFRRANDGRLLERVFNVNLYYRAYESQSLDQYAELARFRRAGVPTPAAPPEPREE